MGGPGERKGPGGPPGLQNRCRAARAVLGGFDSHALPPAFPHDAGYLSFYVHKIECSQKCLLVALIGLPERSQAARSVSLSVPAPDRCPESTSPHLPTLPEAPAGFVSGRGGGVGRGMIR